MNDKFLDMISNNSGTTAHHSKLFTLKEKSRLKSFRFLFRSCEGVDGSFPAGPRLGEAPEDLRA